MSEDDGKRTFNLLDVSETTEHERKYYQTIGRFIEDFTNIESLINSVVLHYSGVDFDMGKALFLPIRVDDAVNTLHRIIKVRNLSGKNIDDLNLMLQYISQIARLRNDIVHRGLQGGIIGEYIRYYVTNEKYARSEKDIYRTNLTYEDFDMIATDMKELLYRLIYNIGEFDREVEGDSMEKRVVKAVHAQLKEQYDADKLFSSLYKPQ